MTQIFNYTFLQFIDLSHTHNSLLVIQLNEIYCTAVALVSLREAPVYMIQCIM